MQIFGICLIKNEDDIIAFSLTEAAKWCKKIYVIDNGSTDNTWKIVNEISFIIKNVIPYKMLDVPFDDSLRELILQFYFNDAAKNDWWCILDGDEFYVDDPLKFLSNIPYKYKTVWKQDIKYRFTDIDIKNYNINPLPYEDGSRIEGLLRYYRSDYAEMRFFRHSNDLQGRIPWAGWHAYPKLIKVKHFPHRSPDQIHKRLITRRAAIESGAGFRHENILRKYGAEKLQSTGLSNDKTPGIIGSWEDRIEPVGPRLSFDHQDGNYIWSGPDWFPPQEPTLIRRAVRRILRFMALLHKKLINR